MRDQTKLKQQWYRNVRGSGVHDIQLLDETWALLESLGKVDEVVEQPLEMALENLLIDTEPCLKYAESQGRRSEPRSSKSREKKDGEDEDEPEKLPFRLNGLQRERAAAFEEHIARIASSDFRVRRYRETVLGGASLTPEQARTFIDSPAAKVLSRIVFEKRGIPFLRHTAELIDAEEYRADGRVGYTFTVRVEPPGIERTISRLLRELPFVDESGYADTAMVGDGSVLGELADLADKLSTTYPWESKADIVHFVLTGAIPGVPPVIMHYGRKRKLDLEQSPGGFRYGKITLEVAPWVPAKTVAAAYLSAKRQISRNRKYRRLEEKSLKMIRFVAGYDKPPRGRRLLEAWNAQKLVKLRIEKDPSWYYDPDSRGESSRFWKDYHRARYALVYDKRPRPDND